MEKGEGDLFQKEIGKRESVRDPTTGGGPYRKIGKYSNQHDGKSREADKYLTQSRILEKLEGRIGGCKDLLPKKKKTSRRPISKGRGPGGLFQSSGRRGVLAEGLRSYKKKYWRAEWTTRPGGAVIAHRGRKHERKDIPLIYSGGLALNQDKKYHLLFLKGQTYRRPCDREGPKGVRRIPLVGRAMKRRVKEEIDFS